MADKLGYDVSDLRNQATAIDSVADNLQSSKESLVSHLATLRGDWVSTASTASSRRSTLTGTWPSTST